MAVSTPFEKYASDITTLRYSHEVQGRKESWLDIATRVVCSIVHDDLPIPRSVKGAIFDAVVERKFIPSGRILSQAGRDYHQTDSCFCLRADNTREGWGQLLDKSCVMLMSGGGVGVDYSEISEYGRPLKRTGGIAGGPLSLIKAVNAVGESVRNGGGRRGAIYASLAWDHPDIAEFIQMKVDGQSLKHTNISTRFNQNWLDSINSLTAASSYADASFAFMSTLKHACKYGDPGFQFDIDNQILRNACTEIITADDSDSCCLSSINFANIDSLTELKEITELGILFLLCNTMYTDCPTQKVREIKDINRRLGLCPMGVAEWFIQRQLPYGYQQQDNPSISNDIHSWLSTYKSISNAAASYWASKLNVATPIATRAIAPTGTISTAVGHTTPGIEPIFHTAYQRTYNTLATKDHKDGYVVEKVIDPIVMKWIEQGYNVRDIDTAYTLSQSVEGIERRLRFQAFVQEYVDNAISSTINLPKYVEGIEEKIAPVLLKYLPRLRGCTFYPDGRYENQPVVPLDIDDVLGKSDTKTDVYESCKIEGCGI